MKVGQLRSAAGTLNYSRRLSYKARVRSLTFGLKNVCQRELFAGGEATADALDLFERGKVDVLGDEVDGWTDVKERVNSVEVVDEVR